ncbi:MAG: type II toxin-antitoxin system PemK/MazF family toxin [Rhizobiales bacterium]|nr:type II toxin-antitoxin system PemK/MazF family toxin [Hyphomicrobiales bacterium]
MTSLSAGDIVWVNFEPVRGSEQGGARPAIVLTSEAFHAASNKAIVCPITSNPIPWPTKVPLPAGMKTQGYVLADQIRTLHRSDRGFRFIEHAPDEVPADVRAVVGAILGIRA